MAALENKVLTFSRKLVQQKPTLCQQPWGILPTQGCLEIYVGTSRSAWLPDLFLPSVWLQKWMPREAWGVGFGFWSLFSGTQGTR